MNTEPEETTSEDTALDTAMNRVMKRIELQAKKWDAFQEKMRPVLIESDQKKPKTCDRHTGFPRILDMEKSLEASFLRTDDDALSLVYLECEACKRDRIKKAKIAQAEAMGIPHQCATATIKGMIVTSPELEQRIADAKAWASDPNRSTFLCLLGNPGRGKSHIAAAILRAVGSGMFITHTDLMRRKRLTYNDNKAIDPVTEAQEAKLLVLDEMGIATGGRDEADIFYQIISYRYDRSLPTIITSNLSLRSLLDHFDVPALTSRIQSSYRLITFEEELTDFRTWKGAEK